MSVSLGRRSFHILYNTPSPGCPVRPAACAVQQKEHVVDAEGETDAFHAVHDFKAVPAISRPTLPVAPYNPAQGLCVDEFGT